MKISTILGLRSGIVPGREGDPTVAERPGSWPERSGIPGKPTVASDPESSVVSRPDPADDVTKLGRVPVTRTDSIDPG